MRLNLNDFAGVQSPAGEGAAVPGQFGVGIPITAADNATAASRPPVLGRRLREVREHIVFDGVEVGRGSHSRMRHGHIDDAPDAPRP